MTKIHMPYGTGECTAEIDDTILIQCIEPRERKPEKPADDLIKEALANPTGTKRLGEIAGSKRELVGDDVTAAIVVDDNTRPCPTAAMLPHVLAEVLGAGVRKDNITIIFSTGTHRTVTDDEARQLLGPSIADEYTYMSTDAKGDDFTYIGRTVQGTSVTIKDAFKNAAIRILTGDVELHYFAGYGGGRKSILPGITGYQTIQQNYKENFFHENARSGILEGNPMHENMTSAAKLAGVDFTINVVQNSAHEIVGAFAGDFDAVIKQGVALVDSMYKVPVVKKADIVISAADGAPHDINLYQAYKAVHFGLNAVREGGVVILVAECPNGHESQAYYDAMRTLPTVEAIEDALAKEFTPGTHKAWFNRTALRKAHVIMVTAMDKTEVEGIFAFEYAASLDEAVEKARARMGPDATVLAMPHGSTTLAIYTHSENII